ncbi:TetR/AcrR family transcriptional regulator [Ignavibacterium sp.]|uniref:TetR/AcrR family transcriptional regulator n=1 Tax=Ignavibacterium sp. TaxID=2651167 RepID=UPI002200CE14|nr:TetR/AcrR family transcriptional regulator [Ignavibacterium sp.]BDQ01441.1 MAG: TetR family transcriptional regulator [Ignavibacterium sp.]
MRRKEGNKEQDIIAAAIEVFAKEGYHEAKISEIAELANVATGSVYLYFESKEDLLVKIFSGLWIKLISLVKSIYDRDDLSSIEKLEGFIDTVFDVFTSNSKLALLFVKEQPHFLQDKNNKLNDLYNNFLEIGEKILDEGSKNNSFNKNLDKSITKNFVYGGVRHLLHLWALNPNEYPLNKVRQDIKYIVKKGILI